VVEMTVVLLEVVEAVEFVGAVLLVVLLVVLLLVLLPVVVLPVVVLPVVVLVAFGSGGRLDKSPRKP
jgi:hypothetical protein